MTQPTGAQLAALTTRVNTLAASLHASAVPLETAGTLYQVGLPAHGVQNFTGTVYVATPQLLATYGIKASQIAPGTDVLTMRPGLAGLPHMEMTLGHRLRQRQFQPPARSRLRRRSALHAEQPLPGQPRDCDGQQPAQRHVGAEHGASPSTR